ncbi:MAG TPA: TrkH family potassium uptake protein, partial [Firmicutes bacterium]|nr:TrkH family potassium uptake protein [Bacillota bacterium]
MRVRTVLYLCGYVLLYLAFAMAVPLLVAMWDRDGLRIPFSLTLSLTMLVAWTLLSAGRPPGQVSVRESYAVVTLSWLLAALFSAVPFYLSGAVPEFADAFFEAASGLTTTGATVFADVEALSRALLFWRALLHWLGGMGIVVLFVAVFPKLGASAGRLVAAEAPGPLTAALTPRIAQTAKVLWLLYIALTAVLTVLLNYLGVPFFEAVTHAFATVATGGFSTRNAGIAAFASPAVEWVLIIFMFLAGGNFLLYYHLLCGRLHRVLADREMRFYLLFVLAAAAIMFLGLFAARFPGTDTFRHALFQVTSIVTTTGFSSADYTVWPPFAQAVLLLLMFSGGCGGSTAGGIKQIRLLVTGRFLLREVKKSSRPREVIPLMLGDEMLSAAVVNRIVAFVCLYFVLIAVTVLYLTVGGCDLVTAVSLAASAQGNIGPGLAAAGPAENCSFLPPGAKTWLACIMIAGRLELYTVFSLL